MDYETAMDSGATAGRTLAEHLRPLLEEQNEQLIRIAAALEDANKREDLKLRYEELREEAELRLRAGGRP